MNWQDRLHGAERNSLDGEIDTAVLHEIAEEILDGYDSARAVGRDAR